ncbi:hypothetical protein RHDC4_02518 [Rhodocyclaceae bacterium]|nr:hypothetical protein RHDC4_02518 [Rhodocyclaceae bacterium]
MDPLTNHILALVKNGAFSAAIATAADYARRNPERAVCYGLLAHAEEVAGYTRAAIQSVSHAISLAPHEPGYLLQRCGIYIKANQLDKALADVNRIMESGDATYRDTAESYRNEVLSRMEQQSQPPRNAGSPRFS